MYADNITDSMRRAIDETNRRRRLQIEFNRKHGITPKTIEKGIHDIIETTKAAEQPDDYHIKKALSIEDLRALIEKLEAEMKAAAEALEFEKAARLRDEIFSLRERII